MKYSENRHKFKSGDIIAVSHYKWASWYDLQVQAVRFFTQSEYSHVALIWEIGGRLFVIESVQPLVRIVPLSSLATEGFFHVPMNKDFSEEELEFALSKVGVAKYSKIEAVKSQLNMVKSGESKFFFCSEFVKECRKRSGIELTGRFTPSGIVQSLLEQGYSLNFYKE